jgi:hypothetical protein
MHTEATTYDAVINYTVKGVLPAAAGMTTDRLFHNGIKL